MCFVLLLFSMQREVRIQYGIFSLMHIQQGFGNGHYQEQGSAKQSIDYVAEGKEGASQ